MSCNASPAQILIATSDLRSRVRLLDALQSQPDFNVVGEASDEAGLVALRRRLQPDILLIDSVLAGLVNGTAISWPTVRVILLATIIDEGHVIEALRLAARGIVPKTASPQTLVGSSAVSSRTSTG
jgi:DNA-binding NarL/FixJ family response regulator